MYLKNIEVHGFKSFANKINFEFHNGITGIVGPNGSGKSNVADAVRWVLGEQRVKSLRGGSMQDVIFAGTEARKPLGYAYVAITLDNTDRSLAIDYDEVVVARKLYRSGESEYLLNGTTCRLKDVSELFYDTGIGKEGYSIIGQGQVEKILSGKPEERRELFDEAAGIVKYKKRKDTAVKKLENEKQNLARVNDILSVLETQIGPLEKQSEKAKEFLRIREEQKRYDVNYFLLENDRVVVAMNENDEKLNIATKEYEENKAKFESIREEYDKMQETITALEQEIEETRSSASKATETRTKLDGQINVLKAEIQNAEKNLEHFNTRLQTISENVAKKEAEKTGIDESKNKVDDEFASIDSIREEAKNALDAIQAEMERLTAEIENDTNKIIEILNDRGSIKGNKERYTAMLENNNIRKAKINSELLQAKSNEQEQQFVIENLKKEFDAVNARIENYNLEIAKKEERLEEIHDELSASDKKLRDLEVLYHQDKAKLESISNMTERYEGYNNTIQKVMEKKTDVKGIIGVVADIIKVDKKYETAIETALGGAIQNIVTENESTAKEMIAYLKENRLGRATFLPLDSIEHPQEFKNPDSLDEQGAIGMACDLVQIAEEYRNVAKSLLGRIVVVDNVDHALKIARKFDYGIRMVTIDGELLAPGGAISGGTFKNKSNLLGRRREMDDLEKKVTEYLKEMDALQDHIDSIKQERNKLRVTLEEVKLSVQTEFINQNTARLNLSKAQEKVDEANKGLGDLGSEQELIEQQVKEIKENQAKCDEALLQLDQLEAETNRSIFEKQNALDGKRDAENEALEKLKEAEVRVEKAKQRQEFEQQSVSRIEEEINSLIAERTEVEEAIARNTSDIEIKSGNISAIQETIAASFEHQSENEKKFAELSAQREELVTKQKSFFGERESLNDRISDLDKEVYRLNDKKEKLNESIAGLTNYMWSEYEISLQDAKAMKDESLNDLTFLKRSVAELKDAIKRLGPVNVNAIDEYREVSERYETLKVQHDDIIAAEETLQGIIDQLDEAMKTQFTEKFAEIKREFDKVFKEMFGGGKGDLELQEDEDILEAGIRINAQPPGKKLQNMMMLSGGEKSLAAIALLFAIQNLKPSPFCLLDEIEAALDESNVGRFAGYLNKLTKHTQFIVITHRRGTMERADRLYGITMQEKGVSTLVSVNLVDKDLDA